MAGIYKTDAGRQAIEAFYRQALRRWPVPNEHIEIPTRHGDTFAIAAGPSSAPALILLHGSGSNSAVWIRDVAQWAGRYRVYAVDIIGEPGLSASSRPPLRSAAYVEWLDDIYQALGLQSASIVGVSLGGWMALDYAIARPSRVASLSLLSPAGIGARKPFLMLKAGVMLLLGRFGVRRAMSAAASGAALPPAVTQYLTIVF